MVALPRVKIDVDTTKSLDAENVNTEIDNARSTYHYLFVTMDKSLSSRTMLSRLF
jgi:hypothetical protein